MRNWENKVIAGAMVVFCAILTVIMFATISIRNKISNQAGVPVSRNVKVVDDLIKENRYEMDSLRADTTMSVDDAKRYLQEHYGKP